MSHRLVQIVCALIAVVTFFGGLALMRPWGENWNATPAETHLALAGDDLVPAAQRTTMAITIHAPAAQVWPWVAQMGAGRGGLYSYEWFENMINCQMVNSNNIRPEFQDIKPGELVRMCAGDFGPPPWVVRDLVPGQALILGGKDKDGTQWTSSINQIVVSPINAQTTRVFWRSSMAEASLFDALLGPGFFIMQRRSLLGIQERVEGTILPWFALDAGLAFWLFCFLGFLISVAATVLRRNWRAAFLASLVAALITLFLVMDMPPVWLDLLGTIFVMVAVTLSFATPRIGLAN